jgi:regulatory protein
MAEITKITAQKRPGRYNIFLDQHYAFSASEKTVAEFVLLKGKELTEDDIEQIKRYDADAKASDLAAHFLSYQPRTVYELLQYLKKHQISDQAAQAAVKELTDLGYLDDREYCRLYIKNDLRVGRDGPVALTRKLGQKGVAADVAAAAVEAVSEGEWLQLGERLIKSSKNKQGKLAWRELKRKMETKLLAHGFSMSQAEAVIAKLDLANDDDLETEALKRQGLKAYKRFRHLDASQQKFKIKHYLFSHGFSSSEIDAFLAGEIIPWDELDQY